MSKGAVRVLHRHGLLSATVRLPVLFTSGPLASMMGMFRQGEGWATICIWL